MQPESTILQLLRFAEAGAAPDRILPEATPVTDAAGVATGWAYPVPGIPGRSSTIDLAGFAKCGTIGAAVIKHFPQVTPATRQMTTVSTHASQLRNGLLPFLADRVKQPGKVVVDRSLMVAFRDDLDRRHPTSKRHSRGNLFNAGQRILLETGALDEAHAITAAYAKSHQDLEPVEPVAPDDMLRIVEACIADTERTIRFDDALLDPAHEMWSDPAQRRALDEAAALRAAFPNEVPKKKALQGSDSLIIRRIAESRYSETVANAFPTRRRLTPFAILLIFYFRLNSADLDRLALKAVDRFETLGVPRIGLNYHKPRAHADLSPTYPRDDAAPGNPGRLLAFLERWTRGLRDQAPRHLRKHLLLAHATSRKGEGNALHTFSCHDRVVKGAAGPDQEVKREIARHCEQSGVEGVTATRIRKAALRIVDLLTGGDPVMRMAALGHQGAHVSERHYPGDEDQQAEALAHGFTIAHDFMRGLQRDHPRTRTPDEDAMCITPGWDCRNPFLGAMEGQRAGRKCSAHGRCPICPLGKPDLTSPLSYARAKALHQSIVDAASTMPGRAWIGRWRVVEVRLRTHWLPRFTQEARRRGETMRVPMLEIRDA